MVATPAANRTKIIDRRDGRSRVLATRKNKLERLRAVPLFLLFGLLCTSFPSRGDLQQGLLVFNRHCLGQADTVRCISPVFLGLHQHISSTPAQQRSVLELCSPTIL